ncbi:MAG: sulfur carrier protein ThiS [Panacagrimonas sp.]
MPGAERKPTVRLFVNGAPFDAPASTTVSALVAQLNPGARRYAVEVNGEIVPRSRHADALLGEGDRVEIVQAVGGG